MGVLLALRGVIAFIPPFVWKILACLLVLIVVFFYGDARGTRVEKAKWEQAKIEAQAAANQQDTQAATEVNTQDQELTKSLLEQKKVDDDAIDSLKKQLAAQPSNGKCPCAYDKSNADPDSVTPVPTPEPRGLRERLRNKNSGAGNKKSAGPTVLSPARRNP
jgi:hypothetical protein